MQLCERIIRYYTDEEHSAKRIFLVSVGELEELLPLETVGELPVVCIDSKQAADKYTLEKEVRPSFFFDGVSFPEKTFERVVVQPGNLYLLDTRAMDKPEYFNHIFLTDRFYDSRYSTTSAVVAIREHVDMVNPEWKPELFFTNWQKLGTVIADLSKNDPYWWK